MIINLEFTGDCKHSELNYSFSGNCRSTRPRRQWVPCSIYYVFFTLFFWIYNYAISLLLHFLHSCSFCLRQCRSRSWNLLWMNTLILCQILFRRSLPNFVPTFVLLTITSWVSSMPLIGRYSFPSNFPNFSVLLNYYWIELNWIGCFQLFIV